MVRFAGGEDGAAIGGEVVRVRVSAGVGHGRVEGCRADDVGASFLQFEKTSGLVTQYLKCHHHIDVLDEPPSETP